MSHRCQCNPKCRARVKTPGKKFSRGHSPGSPEDYARRAKTLSKTIRRKQKEGTYVNSFKGKHHSTTTKKHLSRRRKQIAADPEHQAIFAEAMAKRSPEASRANLRKASKARTGKHFPHKEKTKKRISVTRRKRIDAGLITATPASWKKGHTPWNEGLTKKDHPSIAAYAGQLHDAYMSGERKTISRRDWMEYYNGPMGRILMRSHLEVRFAKWCDREKILWVYEPKRFKMKNRESYLPDFFLPNRDLWVDMKGEYKPENKAKITRFRKQYLDLELFVMFEEEMLALEKGSKVA